MPIQNAQVANTWVRSIGPPAVRMRTMSKLAKVTIRENSAVMAMMLRIMGSVTYHMRCHQLAPSIAAANWWQRMWYVTLPMMRNIMAITALFSLIVTFANFDIVRILTAGGPIDRTHVFATWAFWIGIEGNDLPLGASVSLFMVPILTVAAVFILRDINRRTGEMS